MSEDPTREDSTRGHGFDELARAVADGSLSRRRALKLFAGTAIASLIPSRALADGRRGGGRTTTTTTTTTTTSALSASATCPLIMRRRNVTSLTLKHFSSPSASADAT